MMMVIYHIGYLVMAFDNSLDDNAALPIGTFSEIVEGIPITPANYLNCFSGTKVCC
jgi:hypothetical protein